MNVNSDTVQNDCENPEEMKVHEKSVTNPESDKESMKNKPDMGETWSLVDGKSTIQQESTMK